MPFLSNQTDTQSYKFVSFKEEMFCAPIWTGEFRIAFSKPEEIK